MHDIAAYALRCACVVALYAVSIALLGVRLGRQEMVREDPFQRLPQAPRDGRGLNPLLQHPLMVLHPPMLYLGFVGLTIPLRQRPIEISPVSPAGACLRCGAELERNTPSCPSCAQEHREREEKHVDRPPI
jgi:Cytochrome C assembly protein